MARQAGELTLKQEAFVAAYLGQANGNATEAARIAGYAQPNQQGPRLLVNVGIASRVRAKVEQVAASPDEILRRLDEQSRANLMWFYDVDSSGVPKLNLAKPEARQHAHLIKEITFDKGGSPVGVVLHDAQSATVHLGKHHRLFVDRQEVKTESLGDFEGWTLEEMEAYAAGGLPAVNALRRRDSEASASPETGGEDPL